MCFQEIFLAWRESVGTIPAALPDDQMTLLKDHLKHSASTEAGLQAFAADIAERYPQKPPNEHGLAREVICRWMIEYQSKTDNVTTILMLPLMLFGHFHYRRSRLAFTSYHYLTASEASRLRWSMVLKRCLLPLTVFAMLCLGIALVIGVIMLIVVLFNPPEPDPHGKAHPGYIVLAFFVMIVFFAATLRTQRRLWKMGIPPRTTEFGDQSIRLDTVTIK